jgi:hypothetical protein
LQSLSDKKAPDRRRRRLPAKKEVDDKVDVGVVKAVKVGVVVVVIAFSLSLSLLFAGSRERPKDERDLFFSYSFRVLKCLFRVFEVFRVLFMV